MSYNGKGYFQEVQYLTEFMVHAISSIYLTHIGNNLSMKVLTFPSKFAIIFFKFTFFFMFSKFLQIIFSSVFFGG